MSKDKPSVMLVHDQLDDVIEVRVRLCKFRLENLLGHRGMKQLERCDDPVLAAILLGRLLEQRVEVSPAPAAVAEVEVETETRMLPCQ